MDLKFNHERERNTVDGKIYSQLASLEYSAFCLCVCVFLKQKIHLLTHFRLYRWVYDKKIFN